MKRGPLREGPREFVMAAAACERARRKKRTRERAGVAGTSAWERTAGLGPKTAEARPEPPDTR